MDIKDMRNGPIINYLTVMVGDRAVASVLDDLTARDFNSRGINYCILLKSPKGHIENRL